MSKRSYSEVLSEARRRKRIERDKARTLSVLNIPLSDLESDVADMMAKEIQKAVDQEIVETIHDTMMKEAIDAALRPA
jgi:hypothetical protein